MSEFLNARALAVTLHDEAATALCPTGPWGGLSLVAALLAGGEIGKREWPELVDAIWAARRIPPGESPRGKTPEAEEFREKLETIQARVTGMQYCPR